MTKEQIAEKYMAVYHDCTKEQIMTHLNQYPWRVISNEYMVIMFVGVYFKTLETINQNPRIVADHQFIKDCYEEFGTNIYLLKGFGSARGYRDLIHRLIKDCNPDSISYHIDKDQFKRAHVLYERKVLCLS